MGSGAPRTHSASSYQISAQTGNVPLSYNDLTISNSGHFRYLEKIDGKYILATLRPSGTHIARMSTFSTIKQFCSAAVHQPTSDEGAIVHKQ